MVDTKRTVLAMVLRVWALFAMCSLAVFATVPKGWYMARSRRNTKREWTHKLSTAVTRAFI